MRDDELLERARAGDETAFALVYERYRDVVFRFAYRMTLDAAIAEDLVHDTFLSLIRDSGRFDPSRASLRTYLSATVRYLALTQRRRRSPSVSSEELDERVAATGTTNPLRVLLLDELADHVRRALSTLPALQREAVVLFECEELSFAETAAIVGANVGTVKARLHRARERLRGALAPYLDQADAVDALNRADIYMAGHHHSLQHLAPRDGVHFFIAGGGGAGSYPVGPANEKTLFAKQTYGFADLEIAENTLTVKLVSADDGPVYQYAIHKPASTRQE